MEQSPRGVDLAACLRHTLPLAPSLAPRDASLALWSIARLLQRGDIDVAAAWPCVQSLCLAVNRRASVLNGDDLSMILHAASMLPDVPVELDMAALGSATAAALPTLRLRQLSQALATLAALPEPPSLDLQACEDAMAVRLAALHVPGAHTVACDELHRGISSAQHVCRCGLGNGSVQDAWCVLQVVYVNRLLVWVLLQTRLFTHGRTHIHTHMVVVVVVVAHTLGPYTQMHTYTLSSPTQRGGACCCGGGVFGCIRCTPPPAPCVHPGPCPASGMLVVEFMGCMICVRYLFVCEACSSWNIIPLPFSSCSPANSLITCTDPPSTARQPAACRPHADRPGQAARCTTAAHHASVVGRHVGTAAPAACRSHRLAKCSRGTPYCTVGPVRHVRL